MKIKELLEKEPDNKTLHQELEFIKEVCDEEENDKEVELSSAEVKS